MNNMNEAGRGLIRRFEGFRATAYRDAVGVWTIGLGHTSMAGAPLVVPGMTISPEEGEAIMARDVGQFATQVAQLVEVPLNDNRFSALVSFAYNVGLGNFRRSSVLKSVNAMDFDSVPRRLALWNRAGGRVLPGLTARRAAEGMLFAKDPRNMTVFDNLLPDVNESQLEEMSMMRGLIDVPMGKSLTASSTNRAAIGQALTAAGAAFAGLTDAAQRAFYKAQQFFFLVPEAKWISFTLVSVAIGCTWWIINERHKKSVDDGL